MSVLTVPLVVRRPSDCLPYLIRRFSDESCWYAKRAVDVLVGRNVNYLTAHCGIGANANDDNFVTSGQCYGAPRNALRLDACG
jgi:hypothetical protein